jgi:hypothetical protein
MMQGRQTKQHDSQGSSVKQYGRRSFLKHLAIGGGAIATIPVAKGKQPDEQERTVYPDTSGILQINKASVTRKDAETYVIKMSGTTPPDSDNKKYTVSLRDESASRESNATMSRSGQPSVSLQNASLQETSPTPIGRNAETDSTVTTGEDRKTGTAPTNDNQSSGMVEPRDGWADRGVKGARLTSKDPINAKIVETRHEMNWSSSNSEVDHVDSHGEWKTWKYTVSHRIGTMIDHGLMISTGVVKRPSSHTMLTISIGHGSGITIRRKPSIG